MNDLNDLLKANLGWLILAGALVLCELIYVVGTQYQHKDYGDGIYSRLTGAKVH